MLTKNLVRFRVSKGEVKPRFLKVDDPAMYALAEELIAVFSAAKGMVREALAEAVNDVLEGAPVDTVVGRGLEKLLLDRTTFLEPDDEALPNLRHRVFAATSRILDEVDGEPAFRQWVETEFGYPGEALAALLFSDLPAQHPVAQFSAIAPLDLLHRYNCSLVQWLLLSSSALTIHLPEPDAASLRQLFKYMRFHHLLADIEPGEEGSYVLRVDGPMDLFVQTKKYGLNLALFFPGLLHQAAWSLSAGVCPRGTRKLRLELDQSCGIRPPDTRFHGYVPEEVTQFGVSFVKEATDWAVSPNQRVIRFAGGGTCFPDFELVHRDGRRIGLEIFHTWHASQVRRRLQQLHRQEAVPLLLGVCRKLKKDGALEAELEQSAYFRKWGFRFRLMPTPSQVLPLLARVGN